MAFLPRGAKQIPFFVWLERDEEFNRLKREIAKEDEQDDCEECWDEPHNPDENALQTSSRPLREKILDIISQALWPTR